MSNQLSFWSIQRARQMFAYLKCRWNNVSSENKRVLRGIVSVGIYVLLAKLLTGIKEMVVAYYYGTGAILDGYLFAANILYWLGSLYYGTVSAVLIPLIVRYSGGNNLPQRDSQNFRSELLGNTLLLALIVGGVAMLVMVYSINNGALALRGEARPSALYSTYVLLGSLSLIFLASLFSTYLMSRERHANSFLESLPALGIIILCLLIPADTVFPLVWGTVLGLGVQACILGWIDFKHRGPIAPRFGFHSPQWSPFLRGLAIFGLAHAVGSTTSVLDTVLLSRLGEGYLSVAGYANRLLSLILGLMGTAVGRGILPVFSHVYSVHGEKATRNIAKRWMVTLLFFSLLLTAILFAATPYIVRLLFERGSFSDRDTSLVSAVLRTYLLQVPIYPVVLVIVNWVLSSDRSPRTIFFTTLLGVTAKIVCLVLLYSKMGIFGVALSSVAMVTTNALYLWLYWASDKACSSLSRQP